MKRITRALVLRTQTLRPLTLDALRAVAGGFIMKDSVIVRTGRIEAGDTEPCPQTPDDGRIPT